MTLSIARQLQISAAGGRSISGSAERDLFATTVHELRSPLTSLSGQVQLARRFVARDPDREREALNLALSQVARMDRLLDELVDLSRATSSAAAVEEVAFDLSEVGNAAVDR